MNFRTLLTDDDAVSPVIGVILMVAITVILAAVIASFVLGLGGSAEKGEQVSFSIDYDDGGDGFGASDGNDEITLTHVSGDTLDSAEISVVVDGERLTNSDINMSSEITAGDTMTVTDADLSGELESGDSLRVVWASPNTDNTATLESSTIP